MNKPKLKIVKLRKCSEGLTETEEDELLKKEGCRRLTSDEFLMDKTEGLYTYIPCRVQVPNGPVARGLDGFGCDGRRGVYVGGVLPSGRFGVLGVRIEKKKEKN